MYVESKVGKTGLTVTVDVYRAGTEIVTAASAVEVGDGLYKYELASGSVTVVGEYVAVFKTATATVDQQHIPALWIVGRAGIENLDSSIGNVWDAPLINHLTAGTTGEKLDALAILDAVTLGPALVSEALLTLVRGDDYLIEDQRALSFTSSDWPDLTGADIRMTMRRRKEAFGSGSDPVWFTVSDVLAFRTVGTGVQVVTFELTHANTASLIPGVSTGKWDVQAILAGASPSASPSPSPSAGPNEGNVITLALGTATIVEDQTRAS
jgi:hypothetical protein